MCKKNLYVPTKKLTNMLKKCQFGHKLSFFCLKYWKVTPGPSKLEKVVESTTWCCLARKIDLENRDLGSEPRFLVVDSGVHYRGPLPSPILTV
jgi:hypothetical protein